MPTWWTGLADAPPDEAQALHASAWVLWQHAHSTSHWNYDSLPSGVGAQDTRQVAPALGLAERAAGRFALRLCGAGARTGDGGSSVTPRSPKNTWSRARPRLSGAISTCCDV